MVCTCPTCVSYLEKYKTFWLLVDHFLLCLVRWTQVPGPRKCQYLVQIFVSLPAAHTQMVFLFLFLKTKLYLYLYLYLYLCLYLYCCWHLSLQAAHTQMIIIFSLEMYCCWVERHRKCFIDFGVNALFFVKHLLVEFHSYLTWVVSGNTMKMLSHKCFTSLLRAVKSYKNHFEKDSRRSLNTSSSSLPFVSTQWQL